MELKIFVGLSLLNSFKIAFIYCIYLPDFLLVSKTATAKGGLILKFRSTYIQVNTVC